MSAPDVAALRAAAEAVESPDAWHGADGGTLTHISTKNPEDIAFIAAADPDAVLALLDRLEAAEGAVARVRGLSDSWTRDGLVHGALVRAALDGSDR